MKTLIAYYSRRGNNYVNGNIVDLPVGNTEVIAKKIQELTGGDLFQIDTVKTYPEDYTETTNVAQKELRENARPKLIKMVDDISKYDVIFLGYPNWWGTMPMAAFTFLESHDFSGKAIVPFCTHEGGGMGRSEGDVKRLSSNAIILPGLAIKGSIVASAGNSVEAWCKKVNLSEETD